MISRLSMTTDDKSGRDVDHDEFRGSRAEHKGLWCTESWMRVCLVQDMLDALEYPSDWFIPENAGLFRQYFRPLRYNHMP